MAKGRPGRKQAGSAPARRGVKRAASSSMRRAAGTRTAAAAGRRKSTAPAAKGAVKKGATKRAGTGRKPRAPKAAAGRTAPSAALFASLPGSQPRVVGGVQLDVVRAGAARVKREIYPAGFRWSTHMKPITGTDLCMHAHVGFLAHGEIHIEYADGCIVEHKAPQVVAIEPGHDGWVVGPEPVVLIEFDFERDTIARLGMPGTHRHD